MCVCVCVWYKIDCGLVNFSLKCVSSTIIFGKWNLMMTTKVDVVSVYAKFNRGGLVASHGSSIFRTLPTIVPTMFVVACVWDAVMYLAFCTVRRNGKASLMYC